MPFSLVAGVGVSLRPLIMDAQATKAPGAPEAEASTTGPDTSHSDRRRSGQPWWTAKDRLSRLPVLALVGGSAFQLANLAISLTPIAAQYRAASQESRLSRSAAASIRIQPPCRSQAPFHRGSDDRSSCR